MKRICKTNRDIKIIIIKKLLNIKEEIFYY